MRVRLIRALRFFCLAGLTLGAIAFALPATAQWQAPPWRFAWPPGEIEGSLNAQGYALTAPLMRRPGIYLADVSAGPAGYQRLIIDARSGRILERFPAPGRIWGPALASRGDEFGGPPPSGMGGPRSGEFSDCASTRAGGETGPRRGGHPYSGGRRAPTTPGTRRRAPRPNQSPRQPHTGLGRPGRRRRPSTGLFPLPLHAKRRKRMDRARPLQARPPRRATDRK